jgi:hypothetical protein
MVWRAGADLSRLLAVSLIRSDKMRVTSRGQDAVRILLIISASATPIPPPANEPALADVVAVLESQVLLQKLDFWVRNPDFLADELLNEYERGGGAEFLDLAGDILASDEPGVRRYRWCGTCSAPSSRWTTRWPCSAAPTWLCRGSEPPPAAGSSGTTTTSPERDDQPPNKSCTTYPSSRTSSTVRGWWPAWPTATAEAG